MSKSQFKGFAYTPFGLVPLAALQHWPLRITPGESFLEPAKAQNCDELTAPLSAMPNPIDGPRGEQYRTLAVAKNPKNPLRPL